MPTSRAVTGSELALLSDNSGLSRITGPSQA